jgi:uncharacterized repeat protein (TIGR04042 family)
MPEIRFNIQWPDGSQDSCYSPSLVVKKYFEPGQDYPLLDFVERSRSALSIASERVRAIYGRPCGLALGQLERIEEKAKQFNSLVDPQVRMLNFVE